MVLPFVVFCGGAGSGVSQDVDCSFAHGRMEAVRELACLVQGRFDRARWQRCIRGREDWKEISITRFLSFNRFKMNEDE